MISLETAAQLLDFAGGSATQNARLSTERAKEQLAGAVALHNILEKHRVAYLADEVGLGKTYVALGAFALFRHFNPRFRLLVIAPKENIQRKWMKEMQNFVRNNVRFSDLRVRSIHGTPASSAVYCSNLYELARETSLDPDRDFFTRLTSFGFGLAKEAGSESWTKRRDKIRELLPWLDAELFDLKSKTRFKENYARAIGCAIPAFDLVVIDEGHNLKHGLQKTAALRNRLLALALGHDPDGDSSGRKKLPDYGPRAKRVLFLSATPIEDDYRQIWNQLDVLGFGDVAPALRERDVPEVEKRRLVSQFLIRRVSSIRASDVQMTKNLYRREWRSGGVGIHDTPLPVPDERQRLIVALVQKKVSEVLEHEKFNHSFQIGMLASFESFLKTAKVPAGDETGTFDDSEQTEDQLERQGIDVGEVNRLADHYWRTFRQPLPHPKMDALVETLRTAFDSGRKALVFVRRVASVKEIEIKLEAYYDEWLMNRLREELPVALGSRLEKIFDRYRAERVARGLQRAPDKSDDAPELEEVAEKSEDKGGIDTFFAWFFRGEGPDKVLSGAALARRFQLPQFALSSFFEDNYVAALLGARPGAVVEALASYLGRSRDELEPILEERAGRRLRGDQRRKRHLRLFRAFQTAALSLLAEVAGPHRDEARLILHHLFEPQETEGAPVGLGDWLERVTFFTELREHEGLYRDLWVPAEEDALDREPRFRRRELRRSLIASMFRLGHSLIDLYVTVIGRLGRLDRAGEGDDLENRVLANDLLDLLARQRAASVFRAYQELHEAAANFDLILDVNAPALWNRDPGEISSEIGTLLGEQQPIGGMWGQISKTLVSQFRMPGYPLVLISTDLLQEGEDLHLFCSDVYHYGISWMPSSMEQRIGRIDRVRSHTERRLTTLDRAAGGEDLLQVYYPYLAETVEIFQVNRVLERMDRFIRLMHENLGNVDEDADRRINVLEEMARVNRPREGAMSEPLRSSFPVPDALIRGALRKLAVSEQLEKDLIARFRRIQDELHKKHGVAWETRGSSTARIGVLLTGERKQSFTLFLHSLHGKPNLRCVSPIGSLDPDANAAAIASEAEGLPVRVAAVYDKRFEQYKLTAESDVLLGRSNVDLDRAWWLIRRTTTTADRLEEVLLQADYDVATFRDSLEQEPNFER